MEPFTAPRRVTQQRCSRMELSASLTGSCRLANHEVFNGEAGWRSELGPVDCYASSASSRSPNSSKNDMMMCVFPGDARCLREARACPPLQPASVVESVPSTAPARRYRSADCQTTDSREFLESPGAPSSHTNLHRGERTAVPRFLFATQSTELPPVGATSCKCAEGPINGRWDNAITCSPPRPGLLSSFESILNGRRSQSSHGRPSPLNGRAVPPRIPGRALRVNSNMAAMGIGNRMIRQLHLRRRS